MAKDYIELVEQALNGNRESLRQLAEVIHDPLHSYIFRITLDKDTADDIFQETILEMFKIFGQLNKADRFWPWLCKIALNKVRGQARTRSRHNQLLKEHADDLVNHSASLEGLANVINDEIKKAIFLAMSKLSDEQKAVLSMRCYEDMPYSQIARIMGYTEIKSRLLFYRAKKKLQKTLCRFGFDKTALLTALVIFGKLTAPSEAAAAQISITSATLSAGVMATAIGAATSTTTVAITTGTVITAGTIAVVVPSFNNPQPDADNVQSSVIQPGEGTENKTEILEGYYYYPDGSSGPVMLRLTLAEDDGRAGKILQNQYGNFFINRSGRVKQNNYHYWNQDLSVMILPTDDPGMLSFLSQVEGRNRNIDTLNRTVDKSLLVVAGRQNSTDKISPAVQNYDAMMEERFQYNWPAGTSILDNRDDIHKNTWCYVNITGQVNGKKVDGTGLVPFVYNAYISRPAWLNIDIGNSRIVDTPQGACVIDTVNNEKTYYKPGSFTGALNQQWTGLHCIDTVRRHAAANRVAFTTSLEKSGSICRVALTPDSVRIEYLIDMNRDLIEAIIFLDTNGDNIGRIEFEYINPDESAAGKYRMPMVGSFGDYKTLDDPWLIQLAR